MTKQAKCINVNEWLTWNHKSMHNLSQHTHFGGKKKNTTFCKTEAAEDKIIKFDIMLNDMNDLFLFALTALLQQQ